MGYESDYLIVHTDWAEKIFEPCEYKNCHALFGAAFDYLRFQKEPEFVDQDLKDSWEIMRKDIDEDLKNNEYDGMYGDRTTNIIMM